MDVSRINSKKGKQKMNAKKSIRKSNQMSQKKQLNQEKKTSKSSHRSADFLHVFVAHL
jgi:hypothetical protein